MRFVLLFFLCAGITFAVDRNASTLAPADVQAAMNLAQAGDRVVLPAGEARWASGVSFGAPANVTIIGAGTSDIGGGDQTIIIDDIATNTSLMNISVTTVSCVRLSGITIQSGTGATKDAGTIAFYAPQGTVAGNIRIDHCHFYTTRTANYQVVKLGRGIRGVMHDCILDSINLNCLYVYNGRSNVGEGEGNYEWTQPTAFGSSDFFFVEDCQINGLDSNTTYAGRVWDGFTAAKMVVRFCSLYKACINETHATGYSVNARGTRAHESYGNLCTTTPTFTGSNAPNFVMSDIGNGSALIWGNTASGVYKNMYRFSVTRRVGISGGGSYNQSAPPNGWGYAGTVFNGVGSNWDGGTFNGTDTTLGYPCIDQPGRGAGDLITGLVPNQINSTTGIVQWPNQVLEPVYIWANTGAIASGWGGNYYSNSTGGRVVVNRDYYGQSSATQTAQTSPTSPFDGTTGVGWGTLANRPTTCTTGVAYWATDQGDWNESSSNPLGVQQNGADGILYVATATDTWTQYYEPYTYPHPLRSGDTPDATAPTLVSASIDGSTLTLSFSETITGGAAAQFSLSSGTLSAYAGTGNTRTMTVTPAAAFGDPTYTLNYTAGTIVDSATNALANISGFVVVNDTDPPPTEPDPFKPGRRRGTKGGFQGR